MTDKLKDTEDNFVLTTLEDLGPNFPIGFVSGDELIKEFAAKPWRLKEEKQIGKIRDQAKGLTVGEFVRHMMGVMLTRVGPHVDFQALSDPEKSIILTQIYMSDLLYAYIWLRVSALGPDVPMSLTCPVCKTDFDFEADLKTLEVRVLLKPDKLKKQVELKDGGFKIHGEMRSKVTVRPPLWSVMDDPQMSGSDNPADRDAAMIKGSVIGAEGLDEAQPVAILDNDLDEISKRDLLTLTDAIEDSPGPNMLLETNCPKCKQRFFQMIEWFYDSFFTLSSQSRIGRN